MLISLDCYDASNDRAQDCYYVSIKNLTGACLQKIHRRHHCYKEEHHARFLPE